MSSSFLKGNTTKSDDHTISRCVCGATLSFPFMEETYYVETYDVSVVLVFHLTADQSTGVCSDLHHGRPDTQPVDARRGPSVNVPTIQHLFSHHDQYPIYLHGN